MLAANPYEPTREDLGLIEETIRRVGKAIPLSGRDRTLLQAVLPAEIGRGRRDLFSLIRAARKAIDQA